MGRGRKLESCFLYWELGVSEIRVDLKRSAHAHLDVVSGVFGGRYGWLNNEYLPPPHPRDSHVLVPETCECNFLLLKSTFGEGF